MANTYVLIASSTLTSTSSSVTFSSIPNTFTDLHLRGNTRDNSNGFTQAYVELQVNNSSSGYSFNLIRNNNGNTVSALAQSGTIWSEQYPAGSGSTATADTFSPFEYYIANYNSTNSISWGSFGVAESNHTTTEATGITAGLWTGAAAITSIKITASNNFAAKSTFFLYGIKNA